MLYFISQSSSLGYDTLWRFSNHLLHLLWQVKEDMVAEQNAKQLLEKAAKVVVERGLEVPAIL
ncbi:MAG: hypothetical protein NZ937_06850, partial [Armatimonadetes bacterium]|nr:hypothetical protein [Armatimonadota bacterium]